MSSADRNALPSISAAWLAALASLLLAACAGQGRDDASGAEEEALYQRRIELIRGGGAADPTGTALYAPLEAVPGAQPPQPLAQRQPDAHSIDPAALQAAREYAQRNRSSALLVWRRGALELSAYFGGADAATPVNSRSLAKPVAAVAIGRAIALGKIRSLDQPVADFITEWRGSDKAQILVRHLLDMRSGFLAQGPTFDPASIWSRAYASPRHEQVLVHEYPLTHTPGSRYEYSNQPADLVALVIERATGRRYAEFLSREVFQPIGAPAGRVWVNRPGGVAHAGCCLLAPPELWLRLGILIAGDGLWSGERLLPEGFVGDMTRGTAQNPYAGLGLYVAGTFTARRGPANPDIPAPQTLHSEPYLARDLVLFDGNSNQVVYIVPSLQLVILRTGAPPPAEPEWDNAWLPNTLIRGLRLAPGEALPQPQPR